MSRMQLTQNLLCMAARMDSQRLRRGYLSELEWQHLIASAARVARAPLYIDDTPSISVRQVRAKARRAVKQWGVRLIAVDYIQLMTAPHMPRNATRQQIVGAISAGLKALAKELNVPVVALAQPQPRPSRSAATASRACPTCARPATSSKDADVILLLHREGYQRHGGDDSDERTVNNAAELIIAKQRNGPTGVVPLTFIPEQMRFEPRSFEAEPPGRDPYAVWDERAAATASREQYRRDLYDQEPAGNHMPMRVVDTDSAFDATLDDGPPFIP